MLKRIYKQNIHKTYRYEAINSLQILFTFFCKNFKLDHKELSISTFYAYFNHPVCSNGCVICEGFRFQQRGSLTDHSLVEFVAVKAKLWGFVGLNEAICMLTVAD